MAEPAYAVVAIRCAPEQLAAIEAIPNLRVEIRPQYTDDPAIILVHAFADEAAQAAVQAMGCTVTVLKSAADFQAQLDAAYASLGTEPDEPGPVA